MVTLPAATPVTTPDVFTDAIAALLLVQAPPEVPSVSVVVAPVQATEEPEMLPAEGDEFTVTAFVPAAEPQVLVNV